MGGNVRLWFRCLTPNEVDGVRRQRAHPDILASLLYIGTVFDRDTSSDQNRLEILTTLFTVEMDSRAWAVLFIRVSHVSPQKRFMN